MADGRRGKEIETLNRKINSLKKEARRRKAEYDKIEKRLEKSQLDLMKYIQALADCKLKELY